MVKAFKTAPLISQPCPVREREDPMRTLKTLFENYIVVNSNIEKVPNSIQNHDHRKNQSGFLHTFSNKIPVCEIKSVEVPDLFGKVTIPKKVMEVKLANSLNANICKKVKKEILYLEEEKNCDKHLDVRLYVIKIREIVVAYQHMI
nr:uncharacterized protein LOC124806167 [Hydra vulgaris]